MNDADRPAEAADEHDAPTRRRVLGAGTAALGALALGQAAGIGRAFGFSQTGATSAPTHAVFESTPVPNPPGSVVMNHVGLTVSDRNRTQDFYVNCFGFTYVGSLVPDNAATGKLLQVRDPNLVARYLQCGSFILEILQFDAQQPGKKNKRDFIDLGLAHLSFRVPDIPNTLDLVRAYGGTVLDDTAIAVNIGGSDVIVAIEVRDPDNQRIEVLQFYSGPPQGPFPPL